MSANQKPTRILFICMGNICRSPAAEGIFKARAAARGEADLYEVDSAGIHGFHEGEPADSRMRRAASKRGYTLDSISRPIRPKDLEAFDLILLADDDNMRGIKALDKSGKYRDKVRMMLDFHPSPPTHEVPDPYYGGADGFEHVMDLLEEASEGLLDHLAGKSVK